MGVNIEICSFLLILAFKFSHLVILEAPAHLQDNLSFFYSILSPPPFCPLGALSSLASVKSLSLLFSPDLLK
jgi:hypothetical protein